MVSGDSISAATLIDNTALPIYLSRSLDDAREYLENKILGSRRYGLLASSGAARLRPYGIEVSPGFRKGINYPLWFTSPKGAYALESAATEFECQGLEIDWTVVAWSWGYIVTDVEKKYQSLRGQKWAPIKDQAKIDFLVNKYRVLLTRTREGMILFVPKGSSNDQTRNPLEMDQLADFLLSCGVIQLPKSSTQ